MNDELTGLTDLLTQVLAEETAHLDALDLVAAGAMLTRKRDAVAALQGAISAAAVAALDEEQSAALRTSIGQMSEQAEANRVAIERGLALQMRLIETIAQAVPRARATDAPVYQQDGSQLPPRPPEAYAFQSRM
jgi:hypothetical protein